MSDGESSGKRRQWALKKPLPAAARACRVQPKRVGRPVRHMARGRRAVDYRAPGWEAHLGIEDDDSETVVFSCPECVDEPRLAQLGQAAPGFHP